MINIRYVQAEDKEFWYSLDSHLPDEEFMKKVRDKRGYVVVQNDMKAQGYGMSLISTQVNEDAQHFYRKLGYKDCGGLVINISGYEQPMEMFLIKAI